jgi:putative peptidoglycan lipid II flippase
VTLPGPDDDGIPAASVESSVVRALGALSLATLTSRVLGFLRDLVVARAFGAGPVTDAFFVAFRIPNLFRRLLAEGALSTAFVPVFAEFLAVRPREDFNRMVRAVAGGLVLALSVVAGLGALLAPWIVGVMAPGFSRVGGEATLATTLTRLMFPYLIFVGLAALGMGVLHVHRRFFTPALGPAVLNVSMIAAALALAPRLEVPVLALAVGVLVGGAGQFAIQLPEIRRVQVPLLPSVELRHPTVRRVAWLLGPAVFGLAAVQLNVFVNTLLASFLRPGSISFLYYADRVVEFPLGVFGIAIATAALPPMADQAARRDLAGLTDTLNFALRLSCLVAIPASVGLWLLKEPITRLLFERGRFGAEETQATAWALGLYAVGLTAFSAVRVIAQAFYALGDPRTPVRVGIVAVAVNAAFAVLLMGPLSHGGLALAASASATCQLGGLLWRLRRRLGPLGGRRIGASLARVGAATAVMAACCGLLLWHWPSEPSRWVEAAWLALTIAAGGAAYVAASVLLRAEEATVLLTWARGRGGRGTLPSEVDR